MIKELVQFTEEGVKQFGNFGIVPKNGLHIVLQVEIKETQTEINDMPVFAGQYSSKKPKALSEWFLKCFEWWKSSTMLNVIITSKVFDVPVKAIHTVSPFCFGLKRTNLEGGKKFNERKQKNESQVYDLDRIDTYFNEALKYLESTEDKNIAEAFRIALKDRSRMQAWLNSTGLYENLKDDDYVIFYLNLPLQQYERPNNAYLKIKIFNTDTYNVQSKSDSEIIYGTSNWLNGFSTKKPFLMHQSATFNITSRISSSEARKLLEFKDLSSRNFLPNPLPLFIIKEEQRDFFKILKDDVLIDFASRKSYLQLIKEMWDERQNDLGNYYLLFQDQKSGEIKDFDYISRFEYYLESDHSPWRVYDLFEVGQEMKIYNVSDLMMQVLPYMFNNALVVYRKDKPFLFHWFDDIEPFRCKTYNAFLLTMKYRKAFYDFIYKSRYHGISGDAIREILCIGISDDIRLDEYKNNKNTQKFNILMKLNLLFSLHQHFSKTKPDPLLMPAKILELKEHLNAVAKGESQSHIIKDDQFAFAAGQIISRIYMQSETANRSFKYIEPFMRQTDITKFKQAIEEFFVRYSHKPYSKRFTTVSAEVFSYELNLEFGDLTKLRPIILAGIFFKKNLLLAEDEKLNEDESSITEN
ncbi:hypothetical protein [Runella sp.]|uniref:hypothetical protein n=1 Tax=Runella sp. TaxID=1960881 RepID=UPI0030194FB7